MDVYGNKQKLHDYFISGIASGTKKEVDRDKYGFFLEDFMKYYVIHANKKKAKKNELGLYESISRLNSNEIFDINFGAKSKNINNINKQGVKFVDLNKNSIIEEIKFSEEEQILKALYGLDREIFSFQMQD